MPKTSKSTAPETVDLPIVEDRRAHLDGYVVNFATIRQTHDLAPLLKGLPDDNCQCPHWGYVFKGRITVRYGDHEEVIEAGEAFYLPPGHIPAAEEGTELLQFSPAEELRALEQAMARNMAAPHDS